MSKFKHLLCVIIFAFLLCGCDTASHSTEFEPPRAESSSDVPIVSESEQGEVFPYINSDQAERIRINQASVYDLDEINIKYDFYISDLSVYIGKTLPDDVQADFFQYFDLDQVNEDGELLNETSYVFITFDAQNIADEPLVFTWNSMLMFATDMEGYLISDDTLTSWEMRYRSGEQQKEKPRDYYVQTLGSKEEVSITIGYIIDDRYIDSQDSQLYFSPFSAFTSNRFNKLPVYKISGS